MLYYYLYLKNWLQSEDGQDLVEYALIIALVSILLIAGLVALKDSIAAVFDTIGKTLQNPGG